MEIIIDGKKLDDAEIDRLIPVMCKHAKRPWSKMQLPPIGTTNDKFDRVVRKHKQGQADFFADCRHALNEATA